MDKRSLFEGEDESSSAFKINKDFAKRFEHNKRRELLERGREKFGALLDGESESSESEEDDDGELINAAVEKKFLETIAMIRDNDPKLKKVEGELFKDSDFEEDESASDRGKEAKKLTYKDQIRSEVLKRAEG
jgi:protein KRI1